jgi:hypothetical protein
MVVVVLVALVSLWLASRGNVRAVILPLGCLALGVALYALGDPPPSSGGDGDPMRLAGIGLVEFGAPWTAVVLLALWASSRLRRRGIRIVPRDDRR